MELAKAECGTGNISARGSRAGFRSLALCLGGLVSPVLAPTSFLAISTATAVRPLVGQVPAAAPLIPFALAPTLMSPRDPETSKYTRLAVQQDLARAEQLDYLPERQARIDRMISRYPQGLLEKNLPQSSPSPVPAHILPGSAEARSYQDLAEARNSMSRALGNVARGRINDYHAKTGAWPDSRVSAAIVAQVHEDFKAAGLSGSDYAKSNQGFVQWAQDKAAGAVLKGKAAVGYEMLRELDKSSAAHLAMGEEGRKAYARGRFLRELETANDPSIQSEANRHFQHFLLTAPQSVRSATNTLRLIERYSGGDVPTIQFAPDPDEFRKAFDEHEKSKGDGGLVNPALLKNKQLLESTKVASQALLKEAKDRQIQTENAAGEAIKAEVSLGESEEALRKKIEEIKNRGGDPDEIYGTKEFAEFDKATEKHRLRLEEFNNCIDESAALLSRLDPKLGRVFSASVNLARGLGKLSEGLSKIKFSDMLSVTSLAFALFDAFVGGPDPTQVKLDKIIDMINGLQKSVDELTEKVEKNHREVMARLDDIERGQVSARWEATLFHALLEEQIRVGFEQMIDLQVETLRSLGFAHDKLDELLAGGQLSTVLLVKLQGGLLDLGDTVLSVDQEKVAANLRTWLKSGNHPNGINGVIEDGRSLYNGLFPTVQLLADNALRKIEGLDEIGLPKRSEIDLFDFAMTKLVRRPAALYRAVIGEQGADVSSLYDYEKLESYLGLVYQVSNNLGAVKLSQEDVAKVALTPEQLNSTRELLKVARDVLDQKMFEIEAKVLDNIESALARQGDIIKGITDKPIPMGNAGLNFLPADPANSLQSLADAEPPPVGAVKVPQVLATPSTVSGATALEFKASFEKAQWLQAEMVNEDDLQDKLRRAIASFNQGLSFENYRYGQKAILESALRNSEQRMQDLLAYANISLPGKQVSTTPVEGLLPYRRHGVWSDCKVSGAYAEANYDWRVIVPFNFEYRSLPVDFELGRSFSHPELQKQRLIGRPLAAGRMLVQFEVLNERSGAAEYESVRTPRMFTQQNPGLPGEHISINTKQSSSAELRPKVSLPIYSGDLEIGWLSGSFGATLPESHVSVKSDAELDLRLDYNGVPRSRVFGGSGRRQVGFQWTAHHIEPAPLNQLFNEQRPEASIRGASGVPAVAYGKEVEITPYLRELSALNTAAGNALSSFFVAEQKAGRIDGEWRDGVMKWRASAETCEKSGGSIGVFQDGAQKYFRIELTHATANGAKGYLVNVPVVGELPTFQSGPSLECTTKANLFEVRKQHGSKESDSPLAKASAAFIKSELAKRTAEVVKNLTKSGAALQQARVTSVTSILILRRLFADFGYQYFEHDLELTAVRTGSISGALTNSWAGAGQANRLLGFAAKMAAIESGQIQGEQLIAIVSEARAELAEIRAQIGAARARGARYGTPILDSLELKFAPIQ